MIINCIVQARMGSKRFPGKVMTEVAGKPLIGHLLDNIMGADVEKIVVAIPEDDQYSSLDNYLDDIVWVNRVFGPEQDVAARFCKALKQFPCDAFIRVCADSPLVGVDHVNAAVNSLRNGAEFVHCSAGYAGSQTQGITTNLFTAFVDEFTDYDREHVLSFFSRKWSVAVDTPEDLERIRPVLEGKMSQQEWMKQALPA